jgi:hypothetical protein
LIRKIIKLVTAIFCNFFVGKREYIITSFGDNSFIGYFDFIPDEFGEGKVVYHKIPKDSKMSVLPDKAEIMISDIMNLSSQRICSSRAVNWQLGSRVKFVAQNLIVLNNVENDYQQTELWDIDKKIRIKKFDLPFWNWNEKERFFVGVNFANLHINRPGYGYSGKHKFLTKEVLYTVDLDSGKEFVVSAKDVAFFLGLKNEGNIYFNHVSFNPSNDKFISILLWESNGVRSLAPFLTDKSFSFFKKIDCDNYFSHHCWIDSDLLLVFARLEGRKNPEWLIWDVEKGWKDTDNSFQREDGHPTYSFNTKSLIIDSYPDRFGRMKLYRYENLILSSKKVVAFSHPRFSGPLRCDLHPRISVNGKLLFCDVPKLRYRQLEVYSLENLFLK